MRGGRPGRGGPGDADAAPVAAAAERGPSVLRGSAPLIDGSTLRLARLRGDVVLVVNTASRCGFTPQFEGLEALYRDTRDRGLTVVGFPSNDFRQELARDARHRRLLQAQLRGQLPHGGEDARRGGASAPAVRGDRRTAGARGGAAVWNFTKYLLDREGRLVARFDSSVEPDDPQLRRSIDRLLDE